MPNAGKPCIVLHGELKRWFEAQGLQAHVSVTDETDYAASFCVVETARLTPAPCQTASRAFVSLTYP